jgi:beta-lactamase regulating signal transducer with metallopeptidase domain
VLRRILFVMLDLFLAILPSVKYLLFAIVHIITLITHLLVRPSRQFFNIAETISLSSLSLLAVVMATFPDPQTRAINDINDNQLSAIITILFAIPLLLLALYAINVLASIIRRQCCSSSSSRYNTRTHRQHTVDYNDNDDNLDDSTKDAHVQLRQYLALDFE